MSQQCKKHPYADMVHVECQTCRGWGEVEWDDGLCTIEEMTTCWRCKGTGEAPWLECQMCVDEAEEEDLTTIKENVCH